MTQKTQTQLINLSNVSTLLKSYSQVLSKPQKTHFEAYISGLLLGHEGTLSEIKRETNHQRSISALSRFLNSRVFSETRLLKVNVQRIKAYIAAHPKTPVYFLLDDVILEKTGKHMEFAGWYFDHAKKRFVWGYNAVTIMAVVGELEITLGFRLYVKKKQATGDFPFKSKFELAQELVKFLEDNGLSGTIVFDAWYASDDFLSFLDGNEWGYVSRLKSNRYVETSTGFQKVCSLRPVGRCCLYSFKARGKQYSAWQRDINIQKVGKQKLVICKDKESGEKHFIISNKPIAWKKIVKAFNARWAIECGYRDCKQELGLDEFQVRSIASITRAIFLSFLAQAIAGFALAQEKVSNVANTIGEFCHALRDGIFLRLLKQAHARGKKGYTFASTISAYLISLNIRL